MNEPLPKDPVFGLATPLLFAHRGGAKEVPEGTPRAFRHAKKVPADILELDVNLTHDRKVVVWHGPSLKNVRLEAEKDLVGQRTRKNIGEFCWSELKDAAWVDDPRDDYADVGAVPQEEDRRLLLLSEFLSLCPDDPLNIELKSTFGSSDVRGLFETLEAGGS